MTYARAGHTPMMYLPGPGCSDARTVQVLAPDGLVLLKPGRVSTAQSLALSPVMTAPAGAQFSQARFRFGSKQRALRQHLDGRRDGPL